MKKNAVPDIKKVREKNSKYYQISKAMLYKGVRDCFENANSLHVCAQEIANNNNQYGIANALLVLSGEECVKGYVLLALYFGIALDFEIDPYFRKHSTKHLTGKEVTVITKVASLLISFFSDRKNSKLSNSVKQIADMLFSNFEDEKWWDTADLQKKQGFYVDLVDGEFENPCRISVETYQTSLRIVSSFVKSLSAVEGLKPDDYKLI